MAIEDNARICVVLGGRGFIGRPLVLKLLQLGNWIVRIADSAPSIEPDPGEKDSILSRALSSGRASYVHVDVREKSQIVRALEGASVLFYTDASLEECDFYNCYMIIVQGAKNIITACRECKVKRLIYNSSADVVFDGSSDIHNGNESLRCPWKFEDRLSDLRAQAEALILFANNIDGPLTCVLRPSIVFGPGDTVLMPMIVNKAKSGWKKYIVGSGENMSDFTYVDNVAHAHVCAEEALVSRVVDTAGKAFFITNLEPVALWDFVSDIVEDLGYKRPLIKLPAWIVRYILLLVRWMRQFYISSSIYFVKSFSTIHDQIPNFTPKQFLSISTQLASWEKKGNKIGDPYPNQNASVSVSIHCSKKIRFVPPMSKQ